MFPAYRARARSLAKPIRLFLSFFFVPFSPKPVQAVMAAICHLPHRPHSHHGWNDHGKHCLLYTSQFAPFGMSLGKGATSRLGTGPITCCCFDDDDDITGGGITMEVVLMSRRSSGSVSGAGTVDFLFDLGMLG